MSFRLLLCVYDVFNSALSDKVSVTQNSSLWSYVLGNTPQSGIILSEGRRSVIALWPGAGLGSLNCWVFGFYPYVATLSILQGCGEDLHEDAMLSYSEEAVRMSKQQDLNSYRGFLDFLGAIWSHQFC